MLIQEIGSQLYCRVNIPEKSTRLVSDTISYTSSSEEESTAEVCGLMRPWYCVSPIFSFLVQIRRKIWVIVKTQIQIAPCLFG